MCLRARNNPAIFFFLLCTMCLTFLVLRQSRNDDGTRVIWSPRLSSEQSDHIFPRMDLSQSSNKIDTEFWNTLIPSFECPASYFGRIGSKADGGKWTCGVEYFGSLYKPCVVYSFGVSGDSSFEADMLTTTTCEVYAYDPFVDSIAPPLRSTNPRVHFEKLGIAGKSSDTMKTLKTFMQKNGGHKFIDILKVDVEFAEYASLENILASFDELPFGQLLIEFHLHDRQNLGKTTEWMISLLRRLEDKGLRLFNRENNPRAADACEFSFINTNTLGLFLAEEDITTLPKAWKSQS